MPKLSNAELKAIAAEFKDRFASATTEEAGIEMLAADERKFTDKQIERIYDYLVDAPGSEEEDEDEDEQGSDPYLQEDKASSDPSNVQYVFNQRVMEHAKDSVVTYEVGEVVPDHFKERIDLFIEKGLVAVKA